MSNLPFLSDYNILLFKNESIGHHADEITIYLSEIIKGTRGGFRHLTI